jgi:carbonic anhydrase
MRPRWKFTPNLSIKNDGHSLVVEDILNSYTEFEGQAYVVTHFQFHSGSEHLLHSEQYPLELQVVHVLDGRPALIVSVIFEVGAPNADLTSLHFGDLKNIPKRPGQQASIDYPFNPVHFLPYNKNYYTYEGSLTAPPCAEGIKWVVMQSTMTASSEQIASFPFHGNFRNAQRMMGRPVYFMSEKDLYLYKTAVGSSHILHMSWTLLLGTVTTLLTLAH